MKSFQAVIGNGGSIETEDFVGLRALARTGMLTRNIHIRASVGMFEFRESMASQMKSNQYFNARYLLTRGPDQLAAA